MEDNSGAYVLEVNCGCVGGFAELTKLKKSPLLTLKDAFVNDLVLRIYKNHASRRFVPRQRFPNNWFQLTSVGFALQMGNGADALELFVEATKRGSDEQPYESAGDCLYELGREKESRDFFEKALEINPNSDYAQKWLAYLNSLSK